MFFCCFSRQLPHHRSHGLRRRHRHLLLRAPPVSRRAGRGQGCNRRPSRTCACPCMPQRVARPRGMPTSRPCPAAFSRFFFFFLFNKKNCYPQVDQPRGLPLQARPRPPPASASQRPLARSPCPSASPPSRAAPHPIQPLECVIRLWWRRAYRQEGVPETEEMRQRAKGYEVGSWGGLRLGAGWALGMHGCSSSVWLCKRPSWYARHAPVSVCPTPASAPCPAPQDAIFRSLQAGRRKPEVGAPAV